MFFVYILYIKSLSPVINSCLSKWPGCAKTQPKWPWLSVGKWTIEYRFTYSELCNPFYIPSFLLPTFCFTMFVFNKTKSSPPLSQCGAQTKSQEHLCLIAKLLLLPSPTFLSHSLLLAAHQSVGKFGVWPPARAEGESDTQQEVGQWKQSSHLNEV